MSVAHAHALGIAAHHGQSSAPDVLTAHAGTFFVSLFVLVNPLRFNRSCLATIFYLAAELVRRRLLLSLLSLLRSPCMQRRIATCTVIKRGFPHVSRESS